jgi:hypothetical protein
MEYKDFTRWQIGHTGFFMYLEDMPECCKMMVEADLGLVTFTCPLCENTWNVWREGDEGEFMIKRGE